MSERLPLSPFEFESDHSDSEGNPYDQLTIFDMDDGTTTTDEHHPHLLNNSLVQMWDMTEESDDFPNEEDSMLISHSSTLTSHHHMSYDDSLSECNQLLMNSEVVNSVSAAVPIANVSELQQSIFSEEEYSQELNGITNCSNQHFINGSKNQSVWVDKKLYRPATILAQPEDSSEISIKNNIYQTICPHLLSCEEVLIEGEVDSSLIATPLHQHNSNIKEEVVDNNISLLNATTNPLIFDEETDESTEDENESLFEYYSTTSEDSSDCDYIEEKRTKTSKNTCKKKAAEPKTQKKKKELSSSKASSSKTQKQSKRKRSNKTEKLPSPQKSGYEILVAEGDIESVYPDSFLKVSLEMPATCEGTRGMVPACKPSSYFEGKKLVKDTSDSSKFNLVIEAVNCPLDFEITDVELLVLSCSNKERGGAMKELERLSNVNGSLESNTSVHCMLEKDPSGNDLLQVHDFNINEESTKISYNCSITTSNNHGDWHVKHNYYRILVSTNNGSVIGGVSVPFKVAKNASGVSSQRTSSGSKKVKKDRLNISVRVHGSKNVHHITKYDPEVIFNFEGVKYKVSLSKMEVDE